MDLNNNRMWMEKDFVCHDNDDEDTDDCKFEEKNAHIITGQIFSSHSKVPLIHIKQETVMSIQVMKCDNLYCKEQKYSETIIKID